MVTKKNDHKNNKSRKNRRNSLMAIQAKLGLFENYKEIPKKKSRSYLKKSPLSFM